MGFPAQVRSYTFSLNNRITYASLNDLMASLGYGIKNFLVATMGFTVKYTCDGTTGPTSSSDHTDRLASKANFTTRGAANNNAQSFWVITDASGADWMLTYQGGSDDQARISYSKGGLFLPAGTANQQPTATDEEIISSSTSLVGTATSADRVYSMMASSDKKSFRVFVYRSNLLVGAAWSIESCTSTVNSPAVLSPAMIGTFTTTFAAATYFNGSQQIGVARPVVSSVDKDIQLNAGIESPSSQYVDGINCELQGSAGGLIYPMSAWSTNSGARGKLCNMIDWHKDANSKADGDLTTDKFWIHLSFSASNATGVLWPWDGTTAVVTS